MLDAHGCGTENVALKGNPHPARKTRSRVLNKAVCTGAPQTVPMAEVIRCPALQSAPEWRS